MSSRAPKLDAQRRSTALLLPVTLKLLSSCQPCIVGLPAELLACKPTLQFRSELLSSLKHTRSQDGAFSVKFTKFLQSLSAAVAALDPTAYTGLAPLRDYLTDFTENRQSFTVAINEAMKKLELPSSLDSVPPPQALAQNASASDVKEHVLATVAHALSLQEEGDVRFKPTELLDVLAQCEKDMKHTREQEAEADALRQHHANTKGHGKKVRQHHLQVPLTPQAISSHAHERVPSVWQAEVALRAEGQTKAAASAIGQRAAAASSKYNKLRELKDWLVKHATAGNVSDLDGVEAKTNAFNINQRARSLLKELKEKIPAVGDRTFFQRLYDHLSSTSADVAELDQMLLHVWAGHSLEVITGGVRSQGGEGEAAACAPASGAQRPPTAQQPPTAQEFDDASDGMGGTLYDVDEANEITRLEIAAAGAPTVSAEPEVLPRTPPVNAPPRAPARGAPNDLQTSAAGPPAGPAAGAGGPSLDVEVEVAAGADEAVYAEADEVEDFGLWGEAGDPWETPMDQEQFSSTTTPFTYVRSTAARHLEAPSPVHMTTSSGGPSGSDTQLQVVACASPADQLPSPSQSSLGGLFDKVDNRPPLVRLPALLQKKGGLQSSLQETEQQIVEAQAAVLAQEQQEHQTVVQHMVEALRQRGEEIERFRKENSQLRTEKADLSTHVAALEQQLRLESKKRTSKPSHASMAEKLQYVASALLTNAPESTVDQVIAAAKAQWGYGSTLAPMNAFEAIELLYGDLMRISGRRTA